MSKCDAIFTKGGCQGHLGKFEDCEAEALWTLSLDYGTATEEFGDTDWDGYFALFLLDGPESVELGDGNIVIVPAGNYLLRTYPSGAVGYEATGDREHVVSVCEDWSHAYSKWVDQDDFAYGG